MSQRPRPSGDGINKSNSLLRGLIGFCRLAVSWEVRASPPAAQPAKPKRGEIVRVDTDRITAMPFTGPKVGQPDGPVIYRMDNSTGVSVAQLTKNRSTPTGGSERTCELKPGSRDDLKVGLRARIEADGDRAIRITVFIDDPQKP